MRLSIPLVLLLTLRPLSLARLRQCWCPCSRIARCHHFRSHELHFAPGVWPHVPEDHARVAFLLEVLENDISGPAQCGSTFHVPHTMDAIVVHKELVAYEQSAAFITSSDKPCVSLPKKKQDFLVKSKSAKSQSSSCGVVATI